MHTLSLRFPQMKLKPLAGYHCQASTQRPAVGLWHAQRMGQYHKRLMVWKRCYQQSENASSKSFSG